MLYICNDCRRQFDEPRRYVERHGLEHGPYEQMTCCPFCGGSYEKAVECAECGKVVPESESHTHIFIDLCDECYEEQCRRDEMDAEADEATKATLYANDVPVIQVDYTEEKCKDAVADVYQQYEAHDVNAFTQFNYQRPNHFSTVKLDEEPWGPLVLKPLRYLACCWESLSCSIIADHDPSEKSDAESRFEKFILESVLSTHCIPGQWRGMIARALLFWLHHESGDMTWEDSKQYYWIAAQLDPSVYCFYTTAVIDAYRVSDTAHRCTMHAEAITLLQHDLAQARNNHRGLVIDIEGHKYDLDAKAVNILMNLDFVNDCAEELLADEATEGGDD